MRTPWSTSALRSTAIAGLSFVRGLAMGLVFVAIQTAVYATTSHADTGRATSLFNTQRQISYASGVAVAATVLAASLGGIDDQAPAIDRLAAHQHAFLAVGLIMIPGIVVSWFVRDDDVAETRGLAPVAARVGEPEGARWTSHRTKITTRSSKPSTACAPSSTTPTGRRATPSTDSRGSSTARWPRAAGSGSRSPSSTAAAGWGITEAALVLNRVAASGAAMNGSTAVHLTMFGLNPVVKFGNDRLKDTFLPRAAAGDLHVAFGVTEPDAGTDTSRIATRAVDDGMGGFVVSGRKIWTSKALESEVCLLLARTDEPGDDRFGGLSLLLVDLDPTTSRSPRSRSWDATPSPRARSPTTSCRSRAGGWSASGGEASSRSCTGSTPNVCCWRRCRAGSARWRCNGRSATPTSGSCSIVRSAPTRRSPTRWRRPTCSCRGAWAVVIQAAWRYDHDLPCGEQANTAKYLAAEACWFAADAAVQTHGGLGYATEYHVERYWREARLQRLAPVSQEMTCNFIAQTVLGLPRSY